MKYIQSDKNPQVKQWKKLKTRKERDKTGMFLVEGFHLVEEALTRKDDVEEIILSEKTELPPGLDYGSVPVTVVTDDISKQLADTETTQGIFAVCRQPKQTHTTGKTYLLIDSVQDPGNLGTMIRTADAAGIDMVIVGKGSVDMYNPKVLRSAQGSHFHLPVLSGDLSEWIVKLSADHIPVFGTALENGVVFTEADTRETFALLVGNEGSGVNKELLTKTTQNLYIPIYGQSESLNVAVAAGILLYYLKTAK
ncbi:RNA methyltransferase [Bacillus sp. ISL-35]|uniref:TrmH family RNA methyltransferase n=1 Tax=Bacillus sp. ISL-35 TaxID=2819122 RepID=UPI001BE95F05|nr:RNA methyltransferase [Bacillus sp. ISL-35]MBT2681908.1 RNA methyltransferase [Bacillus sp. ISL-35]MBT2702385.1 RNA methyltransferase [Chryseobacterium sp. ISL-80]